METMSPDPVNREAQTGTLIRLRGLYPSLKTALRKVAHVILKKISRKSVTRMFSAYGKLLKIMQLLSHDYFSQLTIIKIRELIFI